MFTCPFFTSVTNLLDRIYIITLIKFVTARQISFQTAAVNCRFSDNLILLGVAYILLVLVQAHVCFFSALIKSVALIGKIIVMGRNPWVDM